MEQQYQKMYEDLVKAYYNNEFEDTFLKIYKSFESRETAREVLSVMCGVENVDVVI